MGVGDESSLTLAQICQYPQCAETKQSKTAAVTTKHLHLGQNFLSHLVKECNFYPRFYFTYFKQHHRNVSPDINSLLNLRFSKDFLSPA